jgi:hypothetical protein
MVMKNVKMSKKPGIALEFRRRIILCAREPALDTELIEAISKTLFNKIVKDIPADFAEGIHSG